MTEVRRSLGLGDLVLFNFSAVVGIRWIATAAAAGSGSLTLWVLAAILFFVPVAFAVADLARSDARQGGLYQWTRAAFGPWHGFLCGWCYWLNNLFFFPTLIVAGLAVGHAALHPGESPGTCGFESQASLWSVAVIVFITALNTQGLGLGKWISNVGGVMTMAAGSLLVVGAIVVWNQHGSANTFDLMPKLDWGRINFWSQIAFAFGGLELSSIVAGEIRDPERTIPRAIWASAFTIAFCYIGGTAALLVLVPFREISVVTGLAQGGAAVAQASGLRFLFPVLVFFVVTGIAGQLGTWMAGNARLPQVLGMDHLLPDTFARLHPRHGTPNVALWVQAAAAAGFLLLLSYGENLKTAYQLLVDMAVITYFIPFVYLFLTDWRHGARIRPLAGLSVTILAIVLSLIPPADSRPLWFFAKLLGGTAAVIVSARIWFSHRTA